jgi:hypothetical protein
MIVLISKKLPYPSGSFRCPSGQSILPLRGVLGLCGQMDRSKLIDLDFDHIPINITQ